MSKGLVLTFIFLFCAEFLCVNILAQYLDYYGKLKNKKLLKPHGIKKFLFIKLLRLARIILRVIHIKDIQDKKDFVSGYAFIFQLINYIYMVVTLTIAILCEFLCPNSIIALYNIFIIIAYGIGCFVASFVFTFVTAVLADKIEKQKKELESQSVDDNNIT